MTSFLRIGPSTVGSARNAACHGDLISSETGYKVLPSGVVPRTRLIRLESGRLRG